LTIASTSVRRQCGIGSARLASNFDRVEGGTAASAVSCNVRAVPYRHLGGTPSWWNKGAAGQTQGMAEILAYGTAVTLTD
jgi:hypothetical protein